MRNGDRLYHSNLLVAICVAVMVVGVLEIAGFFLGYRVREGGPSPDSEGVVSDLPGRELALLVPSLLPAGEPLRQLGSFRPALALRYSPWIPPDLPFGPDLLCGESALSEAVPILVPPLVPGGASTR